MTSSIENDTNAPGGYVDWSRFFSEPQINTIKVCFFTLASYMTTPACLVREKYFEWHLIDNPDVIHEKTYTEWAKFCTRCYLLSTGFICTILSPCALVAILIRGIAAYMQSTPFIHYEGLAAEKGYPQDGAIKLLSWNICCIMGGYSITDGGVVPHPQRLGKIIAQIKDSDADVNCLYEVFDIQTACEIYEKLKGDYAHFYFNIGPRSVGVTSAIFVASKYAIKDFSFTPFKSEILTGRSTHSSKGFVSFGLWSTNKDLVTIVATHLSHSEIPAQPDELEEKARRKQMELIASKVNKLAAKCIIVTGDLNMDPKEQRNHATNHFKEFIVSEPPENIKTWGGDEFCARLKKSKASDPLTLDYTMTKGASKTTISILETQYDPKKLDPKALSDHRGLLTTHVLENNNQA